jgi:hypothetical protein
MFKIGQNSAADFFSPAAKKIFSALLSYEAEESASWQQCSDLVGGGALYVGGGGGEGALVQQAQHVLLLVVLDGRQGHCVHLSGTQ